MRKLKQNELEVFSQLLKMSDKTLLSTMRACLKKYYKKVEYLDGQYVIAEGTIPIALVAHCDTVFKNPPEEIFYDSHKGVMWSPQGLGADDRAGVFSILQIIKHGYRPHIIFTTGEEEGGIGAENLVRTNPIPPFKELKYIIQLDRCDKVDCVFYDCWSEKFCDYVERFGFQLSWGTFSDISVLCPKWKIAGVNLSIGYENEHQRYEYLNTIAMFSTISKVEKMLLDEKNAPIFEYVASPIKKCYNYSYEDYYFPQTNTKESSYCEFCYESYNSSDLIPVTLPNGDIVSICYNCIASPNIKWCRSCGEPFFIDIENPSEVLCVDCKGDINSNWKTINITKNN